MYETLLQSISGLGNFALYFAISLVDIALFKFAYAAVTPHDEWALVKENNQAAAIAFSGAILGFTLALASAASNSLNIIDFTVWATVAFVAQILAFIIARLFIGSLSDRIKNGEVASGIMVAGVSVAIGLINAACMTY